jgi:FkbM family methyltransferase
VAPVQLQWTALGTWQAVPSIQGVFQALEYIHARLPEETQQAATAGRAAIVKSYSWPVVMEAWREFLAFVESGEKPSTERLYHHKIKGIEIDVWDDKFSFTTGCVAAELEADTYGIEKIDFQPGDIVLDIGAHTGLFAIYMAKRWPGVKVISYEPSPTNCDRFRRNLLSANLPEGSVIGHQLAVTDNGRDIEMSLPRGNTGGNSEFVKPNGHIKESAKSTTLDAILEGLTPPFVGAPDARIKLLKIDAEGGEHSILMGATCLDRIDNISGEAHINKHLASEGYSIEGLKEYLRNYLPAENITVTDCRMAD